MGASGFQWSRNCPNARCRESWERNNRESFVAQYSPDRTALESSRWSNRVWLFRLLTFVLILPPEGGSVSRYDSKHSRPWVSIFTIESLRCIIRCKLCSCYFSNKAAAEVCYAGNYTVANNKFNKFNIAGISTMVLQNWRRRFIPNTICQSVELESELVSSRYYNPGGINRMARYFSVNTCKLTSGPVISRGALFRPNLYRRWRFIGHGPKIDSRPAVSSSPNRLFHSKQRACNSPCPASPRGPVQLS